jgi:predicted transcriptional regulator
MARPRGTDRVPVFVRLPTDADEALNERARSTGRTRSGVVDLAVESFVARLRQQGFGYVKHPSDKPYRVRKFRVARPTYLLLEDLRRAQRHSHQEILRHAIQAYLMGDRPRDDVLTKTLPIPSADAPADVPHSPRQGRRQIRLALDHDLLAQVDALAVRTGRSRTGLIALTLRRLVEQERQS